MARFETLQRTIQVPDGVTVGVDGKTVKVKGPSDRSKKISLTYL